MKIFLNVCCAISVVCLLSIIGGKFEISTRPTGVAAVGGWKEMGSPAPVAFSFYDQTKVVQYYDTYRNNPAGLPPGTLVKLNVNVIPGWWGSSRIAPGVVLKESERDSLLDAPRELVRVLPVHSEPIRYYLAGSHFVAVDEGYKVVDSIPIPSIRQAGDVENIRSLQLVASSLAGRH